MFFDRAEEEHTSCRKSEQRRRQKCVLKADDEKKIEGEFCSPIASSTHLGVIQCAIGNTDIEIP